MKEWLGCCLPEIYLTKTAKIDSKTLVWYNITLENRANCSTASEVIDHMPSGIIFLNSSLVPSKQSQNTLRWMVIDLAPGDRRSIIYRTAASRNGKFVNLAHVDAYPVGGQGYVSTETSADVVIGSAHEKKGKSNPDSVFMEINSTNEPASDYNWNQEPPAECSGPCPAFSDSSEEDIP